MVFRIIICLSLAVLTACTTAQMAVDPALEVNSEKYQITERAKVFSGGNLVFGPYKATNISRGVVKTSGLGMTIRGTSIGNTKSGQNYTYKFSGESSWNGDCRVKKGNSEFGIVSGGFHADLECAFDPIVSDSTSASGWNFSMSGGMSGLATGYIHMGSKKIKVASISKIEGSSFSMSRPTGYYFYSESTIIGGVDVINKAGPVWLSNTLSQDEKDHIAMVATALLLNQVN